MTSPLVLRPANAREAPTSPPTTNGNAVSSSPVVANGDTVTHESQGRDQNRLDEAPHQQQGERTQRLQAKNRRKRYLELHPEYFSDPSLELADPLLYDRLIRRFQTAGEREAEGRRKGFSGQLATDLWRAEAKKEALAAPDDAHSLFTYRRGPQGQIVEEDKDEVPMSKDEGRRWWVDEMTQRFLRGGDDDFDYAVVNTQAYDDPEEERDIQDRWFESMDSDYGSDGAERVLTGETGVQDY